MNHKFKIGDKVISATDTEKDRLFIVTEVLEQDGVYHIIPYDKEKERTIVGNDIRKIGKWRLKGQPNHILLEEPVFEGILDTAQSQLIPCSCGQRHSRLRSEIEITITAHRVKNSPTHISYLPSFLEMPRIAGRMPIVFSCITCKALHMLSGNEVEEVEKEVTLLEYEEAYCFYGSTNIPTIPL